MVSFGMIIKLKPCVKCQNLNHLRIITVDTNHSYVECGNCGLVATSDEHCKDLPKLIDWWNEREMVH